MDSLLLPSGDGDVKTLLSNSGALLPADWASSGKQRLRLAVTALALFFGLALWLVNRSLTFTFLPR